MPDNLQNTEVFLILRAQCLDSVFSPLSSNLKHHIILRPMKRTGKILKATLSVALGLILIFEMYRIKEICLEGKAYAELRDKLSIWDIDLDRRRAQNKATSYPRNISDHFIVDTITIPNPVIFKLGDYDYVVSDSIFRACYNPADSSFSREEYLLRYLQYHLDGYNFPPHSFLSTSDYFLQAEISVHTNGYYNPYGDDLVFEPVPDSIDIKVCESSSIDEAEAVDSLDDSFMLYYDTIGPYYLDTLKGFPVMRFRPEPRQFLLTLRRATALFVRYEYPGGYTDNIDSTIYYKEFYLHAAPIYDLGELRRQATSYFDELKNQACDETTIEEDF